MAEAPRSKPWRVRGSRSLYESPWVSLSLTDVELPSGRRFEHHTLRMPAAAMAVVLDEARERVLLAWRHRFVPALWNYELPGGLVEDGEDPADTVRREVLEETGHEVAAVTPLVTFEPMIGMVNTPHHLFLATGPTRVADPTEPDEGTFEWVNLANVPALIADGKIANSGTLVGLLHVLAFPPAT